MTFCDKVLGINVLNLNEMENIYPLSYYPAVNCEDIKVHLNSENNDIHISTIEK